MECSDLVYIFRLPSAFVPNHSNENMGLLPLIPPEENYNEDKNEENSTDESETELTNLASRPFINFFHRGGSEASKVYWDINLTILNEKSIEILESINHKIIA